MDIKVRQATSKDLNRIAEIEILCFDKPWTRESLEKSFDDEMNAMWVAETKEGIAGYLLAFCMTAVNAEVYRIATDPKFRRNKVAHNLINFMFCYCNLLAIQKILLDVNVNNAPAIALYKSFNFEEDGIRPKYYDNKDDALLMSRTVSIETKPLNLD